MRSFAQRSITLVFISMVIASLLVTPAAATSGPSFNPGEPITLEQDIPINLVFIGYEESEIDLDALLSVLPAGYQPVVRYPRFYGLPGRDMGLQFHFNYKTFFTDDLFEKKFFSFLTQIGVPGDPTLFQLYYNDMETNVLDVTAPVLYIDAPTTERWLATAMRSKMVPNFDRSYTVYFINWWGRDDFKFHVYTKTDVADPDTGYNFGELRASRKIIAWGGSHSRAWFYDLSAGPEAWTDNWAVDYPDLDGDGYEDYRMPAIWEYTEGGYRDPAALSTDLGYVTRLVAINLLFTSSPLYDPLVTSPLAGGSKISHIAMFEDDPANNGLDWLTSPLVFSKLQAFQPFYRWQVNVSDNNPIDAAAQRSFRIWAGLLVEDDCWNAWGTTFAQLFCFFDANLSSYVPDYGPKDYAGNIFAFNTTDDNMGGWFGLLGFADDNWVDGTQLYTFGFDTPTYRELGYGFTTTMIHEFGHHIGMSHPHDGYDSEWDYDYGPGGNTYFAWSGDESDTIMHYMDLSLGFGRFDQDNMNRYLTAGYLNWASELLGQIMAHPDAWKVKKFVTLANAEGNKAITQFNNWNYPASARYARNTYQFAQIAADILGIAPVESFMRMAPSGAPLKEGDPIRFPDN
jgi:hypothetical protein